MGYTHYWFILNENDVNNVLPAVINEYRKYIDYFKDIADITTSLKYLKKDRTQY